ncbi:heavy metal translocating P-type ATPase [Amnibacterium setariae]|uniref:Cation-transporting P-type ATPase B n=1 Tax=Amnibacterium setariae TaxID=2306585 RepID=A0A3A1U361_9MICO|nr:cation-translocating P-type ATPase [Amnibacterium setariae]RIX30813.1 cation-transporting P-type ATPase [Amnibacterium setariae]
MPTSTEVRLDITGMTCAACATRVERRLNRVPGAAASVNFATETAVVRGPVRLPDLVAAVEAAGYGARPTGAATAERDARRLRPRLVVGIVAAVPVVLLSMVAALHFPAWEVVAALLAVPVVTWCAWPFHRAAALNLRHGAATMDTLISLGVIAASLWSAVALLRGRGDTYLEVGVVVTVFVLAGRVAEAAVRRRAGAAVRALAALGAKDALRIRPDGAEERVPVTALAVGDRVVVRPGETVPSDGRIVDGRSAVDASLLTGESVPTEVGPDDPVVGGTVAVGGGRLLVELDRVGADTELARIGRLVARAQDGKAAVQRLADRVSSVFVPVVLGLAAVALVGWLVAGDPERAVTAAVTTLVIACPCALGLATPTALLAGSGRGAQLGVLIRGPEVLERMRRVDTVVLDKTGTLTTGRVAVRRVLPLGGADEAEVRRLAAAAEHDSEHPVGRALAGGPRVADRFEAVAGGGVRADVQGTTVRVGRLGWLAEEGVAVDTAAPFVAAAEATGATAVVVARDGAAVGVVEVADAVRAGAPEAVARLRALGLDPVLLSGDNAGAVDAVAAEVGVVEAFAGASPQGKLDRVRALQDAGHVVAMVGDGVNDAAALAAADLGIAMGGGTDAAGAAADLVLVRDDPALIATAVRLSRATLRTIRGNLFWAFAYNAAALPVAMLGLLNPIVAGGAMAASSVLVVGNSLRLARFRA